jgi:hypothetical protein
LTGIRFGIQILVDRSIFKHEFQSWLWINGDEPRHCLDHVPTFDGDDHTIIVIGQAIGQPISKFQCFQFYQTTFQQQNQNEQDEQIPLFNQITLECWKNKKPNECHPEPVPLNIMKNKQKPIPLKDGQKFWNVNRNNSNTIQ